MSRLRGRSLLVLVTAAVVLAALGTWGVWSLLRSASDEVRWTLDTAYDDVLAVTSDVVVVRRGHEPGHSPRVVDLASGDVVTELPRAVQSVTAVSPSGAGVGRMSGRVVRWDASGEITWNKGAVSLPAQGRLAETSALTPQTVVVHVCRGDYADHGPGTLLGLRRDDGEVAWSANATCEDEWGPLPPVVVDWNGTSRLVVRNADSGETALRTTADDAAWVPGGVVWRRGDTLQAMSPHGDRLWKRGWPDARCNGEPGALRSRGAYVLVHCAESDARVLLDPVDGQLRGFPPLGDTSSEPLYAPPGPLLSRWADGNWAEGVGRARRWDFDAAGDGTIRVAADVMTGERQWRRQLDRYQRCADEVTGYGTTVMRCEPAGGDESAGERIVVLDAETGEVTGTYEPATVLSPLPNGSALLGVPSEEPSERRTVLVGPAR